MQRRKGTLSSCLKTAPALDHSEVVPSSQSFAQGFPVLKPLRPRKVRKSSPGSLSEKQVQCQKLRVQKTEAGNCTNVTLKACWKLGVQQQSVRCTSQGVCKQLSRST